jgi:hypothetical protein
MNTKIRAYKAAAKGLSAAEANSLMKEIRTLEGKVKDLNIQLNGDSDYGRLDIDGTYSTGQRAQNAIFDVFGSTSNVTGTSLRNYDVAADEFAPILTGVKNLMPEFTRMDNRLGQLGAPLTPGRLPNWRKE